MPIKRIVLVPVSIFLLIALGTTSDYSQEQHSALADHQHSDSHLTDPKGVSAFRKSNCSQRHRRNRDSRMQRCVP